MTATFEWKVLNIDCYPQVGDKTNIVSTIYWSCTATEIVNGETYTEFVERNTQVRYKEGNTFTEYNELAESQVLDWVWNTIWSKATDIKRGPDISITTKQAIEKELQSKINARITPAVVNNPLPW